MADYTTNYNLKKPASTDFYNVADFNGNADIIDTALNSKLEKDLSNISGEAVPVANGGTGATTASGACSNIGAVQLSGSTMSGNLEIEKSAQTETSVTVTNPNGSVQLSVNSRRGFYDKGNSKWVLKSEANSSDWTFDGTAANAQKVNNKVAYIPLDSANNVDVLSYIKNLPDNAIGTFMGVDCTNTPGYNWMLYNVLYHGGGTGEWQEIFVLASNENYTFSNFYVNSAWKGWQLIQTKNAGVTFVAQNAPSNSRDGDLWAW